MKKAPVSLFVLVSLFCIQIHAQTTQVTWKYNFVDEAGNKLNGVKVTRTLKVVPPGISFESSTTSTVDGIYSALISTFAQGSACVVRTETIEISKPGWVFSQAKITLPCSAVTDAEITVPARQGELLTSVSAASYLPRLTSEMIVAGFGTGLSTETVSATSLPLPTTLAGRSVKIRDSSGAETFAQLLFVSPQQVNYVLPPGLADGQMTFTFYEGNRITHVGFAEITRVAPSVFTHNASGDGVPAAYIVRVKSDGTQIQESIARFDSAQQKWVPLPIEFTPDTQRIVLVLFGTGWRQWAGFASPSFAINIPGAVNLPVEYAGAQPTIAGLDQINVELPRSLTGRGEMDIYVFASGRTSNTVKIALK